MRKRLFFADALHHVYFLAEAGNVLFYTRSDRLSFYTTLSVLAKRYGVIVVGVSIMFTHVHLMVRAVDMAQFRLFMGQLIRTFSRMVREDRGLSGPVFNTPFGSAPQKESKRQRSSLIYLLNNPVEKHLCAKAVGDRWTFLAYYGGDPHPFSAPLNKAYASRNMRHACSLVDTEFRAGRFLRPALLRNLFRPLSREEQEQLADHIILVYRTIDYDVANKLFGGYDRLLHATEETSGKEFEVGEVFDPSSDVPYLEMSRIASRSGLFENWKLLHLTSHEQQDWMRQFRTSTHANEVQVRKFLHTQGERPWRLNSSLSNRM